MQIVPATPLHPPPTTPPCRRSTALYTGVCELPPGRSLVASDAQDFPFLAFSFNLDRTLARNGVLTLAGMLENKFRTPGQRLAIQAGQCALPAEQPGRHSQGPGLPASAARSRPTSTGRPSSRTALRRKRPVRGPRRHTGRDLGEVRRRREHRSIRCSRSSEGRPPRDTVHSPWTCADADRHARVRHEHPDRPPTPFTLKPDPDASRLTAPVRIQQRGRVGRAKIVRGFGNPSRRERPGFRGPVAGQKIAVPIGFERTLAG